MFRWAGLDAKYFWKIHKPDRGELCPLRASILASMHTYTWASLVLCWGNQGRIQGNRSPPRGPGPGCDLRRAPTTWLPAASAGRLGQPGHLALRASVQGFIRHNYQDSLQRPLIAALFGKGHSDADWPKSYQPAQPCVWLCVSACAPAHLWTHITYAFTRTYILPRAFKPPT